MGKMQLTSKLFHQVSGEDSVSYLAANRTDASVDLDVDSEIPLAFLFMLRLDVNPLHPRIENLDVIQLQARVGGRRAACYTVEIVHRSIALSASTR